MRERPSWPARPKRTHYTIAALIPALIVVLSISGFVWARKPVTLVVDGRSTAMTTQANRVSDLLEQEGIRVRSGDILTPAQDARLENGMTVLVRHAVSVTIDFGGEIVPVDVVGETVADALVAAGAELTRVPTVEPALDTPLRPGMLISAPRTFVRIQQDESVVPAPTVLRDDSGMPYGKKRVVSKGQPGKVLLVYRVVVTDGVEGSPVLSARQVVQPAKPTVVKVGTRKRVSLFSFLRRSTAKRAQARAPKGGRILRMTATGYSPEEPGLDYRTATGKRAGYGVCAVDPSVIPLGTKLFIPGYGYAIAADTGGAVRGDHVDLCFDSVVEARNWGRRQVRVTVCK